MKIRKVLLPFVCALMGLLLGCAAPLQVQPTQPGVSVVDMTVTAALQASQTSAAESVTPPPQAASPTITLPTSLTAAPLKRTLSVTQRPAPILTSLPASPAPEGKVRTNASVAAAFLDKPPVLDGVWDEWTSKAYSVTNIVYGADQISDRNDLGGSFRIGWDNQYLYLAVKVGDDSYVQRENLANIYRGDSIEITLDTDLQADFDSSELNDDDYDLRISPGNPDPGKHPEAYLWFPHNIASSLPEVKIAALGGDNMYRLETAIPWSVFGVTPQPGMHFGFALRINDNDDVDLDVQESAMSNVPHASLADPTTWGDLVLTK